MKEYLERIKNEHAQNKENFERMICEARSRGVKTMLTKGMPQNIYPYMQELNGGGKINFTEIESIPAKTMSSNFFRTLFDNENRVVLSEQWDFGIFRCFTIVFYNQNEILMFNWTLQPPADKPTLHRVCLYILENKIIKNRYQYEIYSMKNLYSVQNYIYENDFLLNIVEFLGTSKYCTYTFEYDETKNLRRIVRGFSENEIQQIFPRVKWLKQN